VEIAIEAVKAKLPVWKREVYEDGSVWKENKEFFMLDREKAAK
jgi:molybdopterin synthase catalytic subunit